MLYLLTKYFSVRLLTKYFVKKEDQNIKKKTLRRRRRKTKIAHKMRNDKTFLFT